MREEYNTPEMDVIIFGANNVVKASNFVDPIPDDDEEYEEDEW